MREKEIIKRCQNGDKAAFDELIRMYYPYVSKYLMKLTANRDLSEDLTQEMFLKVIRTIDSYNIGKKAGFGTYVITIAKNSYIDYWRKNKTVLADLSEMELSSDGGFEERLFRKFEYEEVMSPLLISKGAVLNE